MFSLCEQALNADRTGFFISAKYVRFLATFDHVKLIHKSKMDALIFLTAKKSGTKTFGPKLRVIAVRSDVQILGTSSTSLYTRIREYDQGGSFTTHEVLESKQEIAAWIGRAVPTDIAIKNSIAVGLTALGAAAADALDLTKYLSEVSGGTATSADGIQLKAAVVGGLHCVINTNAFALDTWPQTGETINGAAANALYSLPANTRRHFYCEVAGAWKVADDNSQ